ncbi:MAG: sodium:solute symporter family transporter, partial [Gammaproteobacteria bacterium]
AGLYCIAWGLVGAVIGMCALVLLPPQGTPADGAFAAIVQHSLPPGLRGLVTAAALAALMSTSSAGLLAASTTVAQDLLPWLRKSNDNSSDAHANRIATLAMGVVVLAIALVVNDVVGALTLAYNLLVGGMLVPLIGAVYWRRASTTGAIGSMALGSLTAAVTMVTDGLLANTPIYYSLAIGTVSFVALSLMRPDPAVAPVGDASAR